MSAPTKYSAEQLTRWKREINASESIGKRIKLRRENSEFVALCPFHPDKNPSFKVYKADDGLWLWKCFGCAANGNVFQFVQKFDNTVSFRDAVAKVLTEAGVEGWQDGTVQADSAGPESELKPKETFPFSQYTPAVAALERSSEAQQWLAKRGISMATARQFCLGFVQDATLVVGTSHPWAAQGWVTFPTLSVDRQTVTAVKYRSLVAKKQKISGKEVIGIRCVSSPSLFNLQAVTTSDDVWIAEGEPDTLVLAQAGFVAVGYPSASYVPTDEECEVLSKAKRRFLAGDTDIPGVKAMADLQKRLSGATFSITWPNNRKDANDVLTNECENDPVKFAALLEKLKTKGLAPTKSSNELTFQLPAVHTTEANYGECVLAKLPDQVDDSEGWFPRGAVSLFGAPSGAGKTTALYQLLLAQHSKGDFLGHGSYGLPFCVMGVDRGEAAHWPTMRRMHMPIGAIPFEGLSLAWDFDAVQQIVEKIEVRSVLPAVVLIEGVDILVSQVNDIKSVSLFMNLLNQVAKHFHVAIIGTLGSPKIKIGQGYVAKRDNLLGSQAWGRECETVVNLQFPKSDDTDGRRLMFILPRNGAAEHFTLKFNHGQLERIPDIEEDEMDSASNEIEWFQAQARLAKKDPTKQWWTVLDMERALQMAHSTACRHVADEYAKHHLAAKEGKKNGKAAQFRWNESKTNPIWVAQQELDAAEWRFGETRS